MLKMSPFSHDIDLFQDPLLRGASHRIATLGTEHERQKKKLLLNNFKVSLIDYKC